MSPQDSLNASDNFAWAKRFAYVIIGPQLKANETINLFDSCSHHDDRYRRDLSNRTTQLKTIGTGQHHVKQDQRKATRCDQRLHLIAVHTMLGIKAVTLQVVNHNFCNCPLVFNNQNFSLRRAHVLASSKGSLRRSFKPPSSDANASSEPSCAITIDLQMARPNPEPPVSR